MIYPVEEVRCHRGSDDMNPCQFTSESSNLEKNTKKNDVELSSLSDDIVIEILERLPIKSLSRFIYVAKSWSCMIKDPAFVKKYRGKGETMLLMGRCLPPSELSSHGNKGSVLSFHDLEFPETEVRPSLSITYLKDLLQLEGTSQSFRLVGSCNGIVCIQYLHEFILCNPALHEFKRLPILLDPRVELVVTSVGVASCGKDFKVIAMHLDHQKIKNVMIHLYSSRTNSWRQIDDNRVSSSIILTSTKNNVFVNGSWHWCVCPYPHNRRMITCFDINSEVFRQLELPSRLYIINSRDLTISLTVMDGCLGFSNLLQDKLQLWVMKRYGVKETWAKMFAISFQPDCTWTLLPWKNDLFRIVHGPGGYEGKTRQLTSTALQTDTMRSFQVYATCFSMSMYMTIYEESLVSLNTLN